MAVPLAVQATAVLLGLCVSGGWVPPAKADVFTDVETDPFEGLSRVPEESSNTLWQFFEQRIKLAGTFNELYVDNFFGHDDAKQNEFVSSFGGNILFADPRGSILYGVSHSVSGVRYHRLDKQTLNHDTHAFLDYDPGGRLRYRVSWNVGISNDLIIGPEEIDVFTRSSDFIRNVEHLVSANVVYALGTTNNVNVQTSYNLQDLQHQHDAASDRKSFKASIDFGHDLNPGWSISGGYGFTDVQIPDSKLKNSQTRSLRVGTAYDVTDLLEGSLLISINETEFQDRVKSNDVGVSGSLEYQAGPRLVVTAAYSKEKKASFLVARRRFESRRPSLTLAYALTPLTKLTAKIGYEEQISQGSEIISGPSQPDKASLYTYGLGLVFDVRANTKATLNYGTTRSKRGDYTVRSINLGVESSF